MNSDISSYVLKRKGDKLQRHKHYILKSLKAF